MGRWACEGLRGSRRRYAGCAAPGRRPGRIRGASSRLDGGSPGPSGSAAGCGCPPLAPSAAAPLGGEDFPAAAVRRG
eukprot:2738007-Lingulodinium_polyedra.AAC.1